jgi:hypothetical protein
MFMKEPFRLNRKIRLLAAAIAILGVVSWSNAWSQDVAVGSATATVLAALTVTATQALAFGNVYQAISKTVANNSATAAIFTMGGSANAGISIYMELPAYLALANGSDRMVISFSTTDAIVDTTGGSDPTGFVAADGYNNVNPYNLPTSANLSDAGAANVYLGGKVIPTVDQKAGAYSGDIVLTVSYNGT